MAGIANFNVDVGATFEFNITYTDDAAPPTRINLTGYTSKMQIRRGSNELGPPLFEITNVANPNGSVIALGGSSGTISVKITDEDTAKFNYKQAVYDLIITSPEGDVDRLVQGTLTFSPRVTV